jgi:hypothetical protein
VNAPFAPVIALVTQLHRSEQDVAAKPALNAWTKTFSIGCDVAALTTVPEMDP